MKKLDEPFITAVACAVIGMFVSLLSIFAVISLTDFRVSTIVRMAEVAEIADLARSLDPDFHFASLEGHYDGAYYYAIAIDPFATKEAHELIDHSAYRYSHPGYGWAAWVASFGQPRLVPAALMTVGVLSIGVASLLASIIAARRGLSPWGGLFVALNPGVVFAVSVDTGEAFGLALLGFLILAWWARRWVWVAVLTVALCMTKEIFIVVCAALFLWRLIEIKRGGSREGIITALAALSAGPIVWIVWQLYLYATFDVFSLSTIPQSVYLPFQGWLEAISFTAGLSLSTADSTQLGQIGVPLTFIVATLLTIGIYAARKVRSDLEAVYLLLAVFALCMGPYQVAYPKDLLRLTAMQLVLLPLVLLRPTPVRSSVEPPESA